uniref:Uncharacterized protein n=1 Tax=Chromera velia CCMP2878 TaxID=1169474 RepID=A0A0G4I7D4_9ALVE|eukprot:Cvel_11566.t1-p1 / transcript=Cvel_11566.t1 / gene=Cvel_11566 / organism=Chromera_velia_CCMP2878 / gene_product=hypothetical protein / transcript_product=hypothetical protein / location=Cvel_scaffold731:20064-22361(-) / protein_length=250 / sequence_SO=supercontig / SO=protein_coding / is_pseudo=false
MRKAGGAGITLARPNFFMSLPKVFLFNLLLPLLLGVFLIPCSAAVAGVNEARELRVSSDGPRHPSFLQQKERERQRERERLVLRQRENEKDKQQERENQQEKEKEKERGYWKTGGVSLVQYFPLENGATAQEVPSAAGLVRALQRHNMLPGGEEWANHLLVRLSGVEEGRVSSSSTSASASALGAEANRNRPEMHRPKSRRQFRLLREVLSEVWGKEQYRDMMLALVSALQAEDAKPDTIGFAPSERKKK